MGVARGIPVQPGTNVTGVDIPMSTLFDQGVTITPQPPAPAPTGPDRLTSQLAVSLDETTYAVFPNGTITTLLPVNGSVSFIGVPALDNALAGQSYVYSGTAGTGPSSGVPLSAVSLIETTNADTPVTVGGFLALPTPQEPAMGVWDGTEVTFGETSSFDLAEIIVTSGSGLVTWTIVAPGGQTSFEVPDLSGFSDNPGLVHGSIQAVFYVANISSFQYGQLVYGQLNSGGWNAYAETVSNGAY
jgi:hypothetical protein